MMLLEPDRVAGFLGAAILLTLAPGPDNLMVLALGAARGRLAGMAFGLGCALGCLSHTLLAALGVGALIAATPAAFGGLKLAGAAYLLWLGGQALRSRGASGIEQTPSADPLVRLFVRGLFANAINPKVVIFFLAFLPPFVDAGRGDVAFQFVQLGLLFTLQAAVLFGLLGYFAGRAGQAFARTPSLARGLDRVAGLVFVGLGLRLLLDL